MLKQVPKFTGPDLCALEAHEVVAMLRRGDVSSGDLLDAAYARMDQVEGAVNAVPTRCEDRARAAAVDLGDSDHPGWLAGLPLGIKDLTPVAGVRCTFGTPGMADNVPAVSDPLVERIEARGGVVAGKTNTPEFGAGGNTFNPVLGVTLNPHDTWLNAGGSSGGAAASLATGSLWLNHGSDLGGSLRTPAAYCGVVGLRPTPGRAGGGGAQATFLGEGVEGPMGRSVRDVALFLDTMSGFEPRWPVSFPAPDTPFQQAVERAEGGLRFAYLPDLGGYAPLEPDLAAEMDRGMAQVARSGNVVDSDRLNLDGLERTFQVLRGLLFVSGTGRLPPQITQHFKATLRENIDFGRSLTVEDIAEAQVKRGRIYEEMRQLLTRHDVLACAVVGNMPRPQSEEWVREVNGVPMSGYMDWLRFAFLATVAGLPAISVPLGRNDRGLPVAIQLIGPPRGEATLLAAARIVEQAVGGPLGPVDPVVRPAEG